LAEFRKAKNKKMETRSKQYRNTGICDEGGRSCGIECGTDCTVV
jgi:hypothetical protein